jgi:hypothetical protein
VGAARLPILSEGEKKEKEKRKKPRYEITSDNIKMFSTFTTYYTTYWINEYGKYLLYECDITMFGMCH